MSKQRVLVQTVLTRPEPTGRMILTTWLEKEPKLAVGAEVRLADDEEWWKVESLGTTMPFSDLVQMQDAAHDFAKRLGDPRRAC